MGIDSAVCVVGGWMGAGVHNTWLDMMRHPLATGGQHTPAWCPGHIVCRDAHIKPPHTAGGVQLWAQAAAHTV